MLQGNMVMPCFIGVKVRITKKKHKTKISAENRYQTAYRTPFTEVVLNYMRCYMVLIYIAIWFQYTSPGHTKAGCGRQPAGPL
jgi:hypothetical protein